MKKEARLILGGGAAYGLAHIGAIAALKEHYEITGIVGTSMGAIIGALAALGKTPEQMLEIALDRSTAKIFSPLNLDIRRRGIFDGKAAVKLFASWTDGAGFEDLIIPFIAVSYDLGTRSTVLIDSGSLADAMRASSSLPYIFAPHALGRYLFVDGGVEHPLPVAFRDRVPGKLTIAVNVLPPISTKVEVIEPQTTKRRLRLGLHQVLVQAMMQNQGFVAIQSMLQNPPDLIIDAHLDKYKLYDLKRAEDFYKHGYRVAQQCVVEHCEPRLRDLLLKRYQNLMAKFGRL